MGLDNPTELGNRQKIQMRYGPGTPVMGMRRRGQDPGAYQLPYWQFLRNVRFDDGIGARKRRELFMSGLGDGAGSIVAGLYDFQCTRSAGKLYIIYAGCPGIAGAATGQSLCDFDFEQAEQLSRGIYWASATFEACLAGFAGRLYIGRDSTLSAFITIEPDYEDEALFISGLDQAEQIKSFTGYTVRCAFEAFGELFVGLENIATPAASKIVRWDGVTFRDDKTGIDPPSCIKLFRNTTLVVSTSNAAGGILLRDSAGAWTAVAGAFGNVQVVMAEYRDNLYLTEDGPDLWKFDGTTLAIDRTILTARINGLAAGFGYLYYGHDRSAALKDATLGRLDSAGAYTDVHKNIAAQAGFAWADLVKRISFYRGALIIGVESTVNGGRLFLSPGSDTAGTWEIVTPVDPLAPAYGAIVAFTVL